MVLRLTHVLACATLFSQHSWTKYAGIVDGGPLGRKSFCESATMALHPPVTATHAPVFGFFGGGGVSLFTIGRWEAEDGDRAPLLAS